MRNRKSAEQILITLLKVVPEHYIMHAVFAYDKKLKITNYRKSPCNHFRFKTCLAMISGVGLGAGLQSSTVRAIREAGNYEALCCMPEEQDSAKN